MRSVAFPVYALVLPSLFALAFAGPFDCRAENVVAENVQIPLGHQNADYRLVCHSIARSISPASQVFSPGTVFTLFSVLLLHVAYVDPQILPNLRKISPIGLTRVHRHPRAP
jgi:hypothetical protein